jgi:hypothetical protein
MYEQIASTIALSLGVAWASGINLYAAMFMLGFMGANGYIDLPPGLHLLEDPIVLAASALMYFVEFFTDKVPGLDTGWDTLHSFIRIPAGAVLAAGAVSGLGMDPAGQLAAEILAGLFGATAATASHAAKSGTRVLINTSPEPFSNWAASISEDVAVIGGLWVALDHPWVFLALFVLWIVFLIWALPRVWRGIKKVFRWLCRLLGGCREAMLPPGDAAPSSPPAESIASPTPGNGRLGGPELEGERLSR